VADPQPIPQPIPQPNPLDPTAGSLEERLPVMAAIRATAHGSVDTPAGRYFATAAGVRAALADVDRFVGSFIDTTALPADEVMLSAVPEPEHGRLRKVVNSVVAHHRLAPAEPFIRTTAAELVAAAVAAAADGSPVDLVAAVSDPLPSAVIAHMLGVPQADRERFRIWSDELLDAQQDRRARTLSQAHPEFAAYIQRLIDDRRAAEDPPDDIVTRLLQTAYDDGTLLSDAAVRTQTMFLIVAGNETTRNLVANCLHTLAAHPDIYAAVRADPALLPALVEESLRLDAPVQILARAVRAPTEVAGCPLAAGDRVVLGIASANRDESVYADPDVLRLDRANPRDHLAFGTGPHVCPGASLARLETLAVLQELCARAEKVRLAPDFTPEPGTVFWAHGQRRLPCLITPADPC
jgi:cytochrome P450